MRKPIWWAFLLFLCVIGLYAQDTSTEAATDVEHSKWIAQVIESLAKIKPGMTRGSIARLVSEDGGLQFRTQGRFTDKHCLFIKIDVEFAPVGEGSLFSREDKVVKVSRPYLGYPVSD